MDNNDILNALEALFVEYRYTGTSKSQIVALARAEVVLKLAGRLPVEEE